MPARHVKIKLLVHWYMYYHHLIYYIHYILISQLEWPILCLKQFLIKCEWCSHTYRLVRSILVWSWLESLNSVKLTIWSVMVVPAAVCSCRKNLDWMWICCEASIEHEVVAKAWIKHVVVAKAWIKHVVVAKAWIKHKVVAKAYTCILYHLVIKK